MTTVVTIAARLGARVAAQGADRLLDEEDQARHQSRDSWSWPLVWLALGADPHLGPHPQAEFGRRLLGVAAADLVADDAALVELDHAAAHVVDHLAVVGDDERRWCRSC